jgi:hypothetical protein
LDISTKTEPSPSKNPAAHAKNNGPWGITYRKY